MQKLEDFHSGGYIVQQRGAVSEYRSFLPAPVNHEWSTNDAEANKLLGDAMLALGSLNSLARLIPNVDVYIKMHIRTEANTSSKIEGTRTSIEEDLLPIEEIVPEKRNDYQEVQNYVAAITYGIETIQSENGLPLCNRLLRECHQRLMYGVRGEYKTPGEFRRSQNWIGGNNINSATYVPPCEMDLPELMSDFEKFINLESDVTPPLMKIAILHYQFETIHPFLDGNGRIGRLMIPLSLLSQGILTKPCFYISNYLESHRPEYYNALQMARTKNALLDWYKFFLKATIYTANSAVQKFEKVTCYVDEVQKYLLGLSKKNTQNISSVIQLFYAEPTMTIAHLQERLGLSKRTLNTILNSLVDDGILTEITGFSRNRIYKFKKYIDLFLDEQ